jgi:transcriptional regulator with XRE-family HTH domain
MIAIEQIRAARALLNWSQSELAALAGLSLNALSKLEKGQTAPRVETLAAIEGALERGGVEFLSGKGVRLKGELFEMEKVEGPELMPRHLEDMLDVLAHAPKVEREILYCVDNTRFGAAFPAGIKQYLDFYPKYQAAGITIKSLLREGDHNFVAPDNIYRWAPAASLGEIPYGVYGHTVALILWGPPERLVLIRNAAIAETFRRQFYSLWQNAALVPEVIYR